MRISKYKYTITSVIIQHTSQTIKLRCCKFYHQNWRYNDDATITKLGITCLLYLTCSLVLFTNCNNLLGVPLTTLRIFICFYNLPTCLSFIYFFNDLSFTKMSSLMGEKKFMKLKE